VKVGFRSELEAAGRGERTALMVRVVHGTRLGRWAEQLAHAQGPGPGPDCQWAAHQGGT
jgi:hypothetical protein